MNKDLQKNCTCNGLEGHGFSLDQKIELIFEHNKVKNVQCFEGFLHYFCLLHHRRSSGKLPGTATLTYILYATWL